jgi:hypothetical protein
MGSVLTDMALLVGIDEVPDETTDELPDPATHPVTEAQSICSAHLETQEGCRLCAVTIVTYGELA